MLFRSPSWSCLVLSHRRAAGRHPASKGCRARSPAAAVRHGHPKRYRTRSPGRLPRTTGTPSSQIVYDIFLSHTAGGEDFSHPTWTTAPGVTSFETPALKEPSYFVVRARDQAGNEDQNTVERVGEDPCEGSWTGFPDP